MSAQRTYVVTGARSGIGAALAQALQASGGRVIGIDLAGMEVNCDLGSAEGRTRMVAEVKALAPRGVHGLAACAGVVGAPAKMLAVNYFGAVATLAELRPLLIAAEQPRAVAIASMAVMDPFDEATAQACLSGDEAKTLASVAQSEDVAGMYSTSKIALTRWCRAAAVSPEWGGSGALLNLIAPGVIRTPMSAESFKDPVRVAWFEDHYRKAMDRWGEAEDVARLAAFLLSPDNSYMVGQLIFCDGGVEAVRHGPAVGGVPGPS
jgi:NAD(P)-dependent dehydrogenase (short-subunit alcohol dehydrogenase family)